MKTRTLMTILIGFGLSSSAVADPTSDRLDALAKQLLESTFNDPVVIEAVTAQNAQNQDLAQSDIDRLDKQWRAEAKSGAGPLIDSVLARALSSHLKTFKESGEGLYTEIFVMDAKGLNVGQSDITSDYWQGDEAKWRNTFLKGSDSVFVDKVEFDESTQTFQSQISMTLTDPATKAPVGAVTVGVNIESLN